jgi:hypothetical protein
MYADLPEEEDGHTDFFADRKPVVRIAKRLSDPRCENRLRMTLGHEYGHVWFHAPLWRKSRPDDPGEPRWTCHRDRIVDAPQSDWMEFQAAYIGGALLMPSYSVKLWAGEIAMGEAKQPPVSADSDLGRAMIERVTRVRAGRSRSSSAAASLVPNRDVLSYRNYGIRQFYTNRPMIHLDDRCPSFSIDRGLYHVSSSS